LAEDLRRFLRSEAIRARPRPWRQKAWHAVRRRPAAAVTVLLLAGFAAFLAWVGSRLAWWDEWAYLRAAAGPRQQLARGEAVELIGPSRREWRGFWRLGEGQVLPLGGPDAGGVRLTALVPSLVELLPDPGRGSYQIDVEMRHDESFHSHSDVGVFVAGTHHVTGPGTQHFFIRASFADLGVKATSAHDEQGCEGSEFTLNLWHNGNVIGGPFRIAYTQRPGIFFQPDNPLGGPGPWRHFRVEVRPGEVRAWWGGKVLSLSPDKEAPDWLALLQGAHPDLRQTDISFPARGALGIHLYASTVSVRRFTVGPLAETGP
jgi:hypothetical protein